MNIDDKYDYRDALHDAWEKCLNMNSPLEEAKELAEDNRLKSDLMKIKKALQLQKSLLKIMDDLSEPQ